MKIDGVAAIVTGGGSGLGAATAKLLAARGAKVAIFDRDPVAGKRNAAETGVFTLFSESPYQSFGKVYSDIACNKRFFHSVPETGVLGRSPKQLREGITPLGSRFFQAFPEAIKEFQSDPPPVSHDI